MTRKTRALATKWGYDRLADIRRDLRHNADYYAKGTWRGEAHRRAVAGEIRDIREALAELRFVEWAKRDAA